MSGANVELLTNLRNESVVNTVSGALALTMSSFWLINDNYKKTHDIYNRFRLPVVLGFLYGATNVIKGSIGINKYNQLLIEAVLDNHELTFFLAIPANNITGTKSLLTTTTKFDIKKIIAGINIYLNKISGLKIIDITVEEVNTGATANGNTIASNIKVDLIFIITNTTSIDRIVHSILSGQISVLDNTGSTQKLNISSVISSVFNNKYPYPSPFN
uniref:Uncharacterized protein n=1 Tax=viral metagenome TaxID=1070528 RepID=A0A6C0ILB8_9ZZZZ